MPAVMSPRHQGVTSLRRTIPQKVAIGFGVGFIVIGFAGVVMPGFLGMHLSVAHNLIHLASGALALWAGYSDGPNKAYYYCLSFGIVYGLLGIMGFLIGQPGYPSVGHMAADQNLLRVIPNILEFGSSDHIVHLLIAAFLIITAMSFGRNDRPTTRPLRPNADTDLSSADLGESDVNRRSDIARRKNFERKI
jgi:hypothetical protein